ncbi:MAG: 5'/3'-nucleotidase SurE [Hyphomicrobiales bacterium]
MADAPLTILCTNDDGINAEGILVLEEMAHALTDDVWTVAPETEQSGASHSLSLANPLRLRRISERRFAVHGTPSDSVLMAVRKVMPKPPDLVISGVNRGQNLADDVTYSGTIAAAMEGTALGFRSIAFSQTYGVHSEGRLRWDVAKAHGPRLLQQLAGIELGPGVLLNVNFPDCEPIEVEGVEVTRQGKRDQNQLYVDERRDARGVPYFWLGFKRESSNPAAGTDLRAVFDKRISVSPLHMNLTQVEAMEALRVRLQG